MVAVRCVGNEFVHQSGRPRRPRRRPCPVYEVLSPPTMHLPSRGRQWLEASHERGDDGEGEGEGEAVR